MSRANILTRNDSAFSRRSRSPYTQQPDVRLQDDSEGNIEGVEYLSGWSGYESDVDRANHSRRPSVTSTSSRSSRRRQKRMDSWCNSHSSSRPLPAAGRRKSCSNKNKVENIPEGTRLGPSPGKRPWAHFTLSSPETSGQEDDGKNEDEDVPAFSLEANDGTLRPDPSIGKSPLLNRDLLRFVQDVGVGHAEGLEPVMVALGIGGGSDGASPERWKKIEEGVNVLGSEASAQVGAGQASKEEPGCC